MSYNLLQNSAANSAAELIAHRPEAAGLAGGAASAPASTAYRPHIDGLRAIAILSVLLYHVGLTPFSGGFVGVDVFFVISGYLITEILTRDIANGRFSILAFYDRRIRRIFPALFTVLIAIATLAWFVYPDDLLKKLSEGIVATVLFASNILFWLRFGYFNHNASGEPVIHTWSLAVEEQFYIVFPVLLFGLFRTFKRQNVAIVIAVLAAISFLLSAWCAYRYPRAAFYLTPFRAWELLLGALAALQFFPPFRHPVALRVQGWIGLGLIAWAVTQFTPLMVFPGVNALVPCLGALLLIRAEPQTSSTGRLLSTKPFVFLGLISYSLYLWHWPLLVFAKALNIGDLSTAQTAAVLALSIVLATLTWRYIENPARRQHAAAQRPVVFALATVAIAAGFTFGMAGHVQAGWPQRLPQQALQLERGLRDFSPRREECHSEDNDTRPYEQKCVYGAPNVKPEYAIWGDSHAVELAVALGDIAAENGSALLHISYSNCPPSYGDEAPSGAKCRNHNNEIFRKLSLDTSKRIVILISRYREALSQSGFRAVVNGLLDSGKTVAIVYPLPSADDSVPVMLTVAAMEGRDPNAFSISYAKYRAENASSFAFLDSLPRGGNLVRIYPHQRLCGDTRCAMSSHDVPLYFDDHHISVSGAKYLKPLFESLFASERKR